jgi:hypothetical protein
MKKSLIVLLFCFISLGLIADEVTNPFVLPAKKKFMINYGYQYLSSNIASSDSRGTVKIHCLRGMGFYGLTDNFSVYAKFGMSSFNTKATKGEWEQMFGFGARGILLEKPFKLAVDFHLSRMFTDGESKTTGIMSDIDWQEIQLAIASTYDIKPLSTYFGMKIRKVDGMIDPREYFSEITFNQDKSISIFAGFDYPLTEKIVIEVEGGAIGESYISISSRYIF